MTHSAIGKKALNSVMWKCDFVPRNLAGLNAETKGEGGPGCSQVETHCQILNTGATHVAVTSLDI